VVARADIIHQYNTNRSVSIAATKTIFALFVIRVERPNDPSSATRRTGRTDCNRDAPAGLDAMKGLNAWAKRAHAFDYE
jgi:hypothetical protein